MIAIRVRESHKRAIEQAAKRLGYTNVSEMMRDLAKRACNEAGVEWEETSYTYGWRKQEEQHRED